MEIVLYEPEIPGNTGNIARLCAANHMTLHLIKPLGFSIDDKHVKRAGLDYWHLVDVQVHESIDDLYAKYPERRYFYATTKAPHTHSEVSYEIGDMLVFGPESRGLPESLLAGKEDYCIRIPMVEAARSLNLSNAVAVVAYEGMRQLNYPDLKAAGNWINE
ncbi:tRNA (uridine(34)/cytosine(34)/5-carboxymethylaminomethyluridine(34)-2'-O)-methyltransferase TrmL [Veillonella agrestimuris]|uniref:tRNA (uridine(34)/cytosine(34)/5- carboxymethylaminomethyluridine(34)-2'-O)- methyltransferase TrmL n=1 Tax=Veillonella agrestimuris TaxID=2941340 RepID=UPI00203C9B5F|nr:tRNA (uridine(34)/cytosine(34)/5-carboxymethylaminomethyluridine(34)-2'-O)-methyltransferase TrmL [Veillonella agrestimuris]